MTALSKMSKSRLFQMPINRKQQKCINFGIHLASSWEKPQPPTKTLFVEHIFRSIYCVYSQFAIYLFKKFGQMGSTSSAFRLKAQLYHEHANFHAGIFNFNFFATSHKIYRVKSNPTEYVDLKAGTLFSIPSSSPSFSCTHHFVSIPHERTFWNCF